MKVLYHANCNDGSGAALAAWLNLGENAEYIPVQYGSHPPEFGEGEDLYILDFSYKRPVLEEMAEKARYITILDHHKSAEEDLSGELPGNVRATFNMNKAGCVLAWEFFHPDEPLPELFKYLQDRDLWKKELPDTDLVAYGLSVYSQDFRDWKNLVDSRKAERHLDRVINDGDAIASFLEIERKKILQTDTRQRFCEYTDIPVYNAPGFMASDLCHDALKLYPSSPFAVAFFDLPDKRVYSLRSRSWSDVDVDVSQIAKNRGGGGHKHAAGFTADRTSHPGVE